MMKVCARLYSQLMSLTEGSKEYRVLPGFEPGTSAWPGRGPPELRTRPVPSVATSGESATFGDRIKYV